MVKDLMSYFPEISSRSRTLRARALLSLINCFFRNPRNESHSWVRLRVALAFHFFHLPFTFSNHFLLFLCTKIPIPNSQFPVPADQSINQSHSHNASSQTISLSPNSSSDRLISSTSSPLAFSICTLQV